MLIGACDPMNRAPSASHKVAAAQEQSLFSCRPGVGDAFMNVVELVADFDNASDPRVCNWTAPALSTLPDSGSRTCAGALLYTCPGCFTS